jgi:hypothetical protein
VLRYLGRYEESLEVSNKVLEMNPKDESALTNKGIALGNLGRYEEALEAFNKALEINPEDEYVLSIKGLTLIYLGRYEEALDAFEKTLKTNPQNGFALSRKGVVLLSLDRYEEALDALNKALEIKSRDDYALLNKGVALGFMGRHEEALDAINKSLEINPMDYKALLYKGIALGALKRNAEALEAFEEALEISPDYKNALTKFVDVSFNAAIDELKAGNQGNAGRLIQKAYSKGAKLEADSLAELTISFLKNAAETGDLAVIKTALDEVIKIKGDEYRELLKPVIMAIEIIETRDIQKYSSLQVEEREIVADIVKTITRSDELVPDEIKRKEGLKAP